MTRKVSINRRWTEPVPIGKDGTPLNKRLWPQRRKHVWIVRWFAPGPDGQIKRLQRTFKTRTEAEAFQAARQDEFNSSPQARRVARKVTLGEFITEFVKLRTGPKGQRLKARSLAQARQSLDQFAKYIGRDCLLCEVATARVACFFAMLRDRKLSPATVNMRKRTLKAAFSVAVSPLAYLRENPFRTIRADRVTRPEIRYVTAAEFAAILSACDDLPSEHALWWRTLLSVCYAAGLRYSEVLNVVWSDVDFANDMIRVTEKRDSKSTVEWSPKDYETREIPVPAETVALLARMQETVPADGCPYVFVSQERLAFVQAAKAAGVWSEERPVLNNFHRTFAKILKRAAMGCPSLVDADGRHTVSLHDLRRTAITNWSKVANIQTVMAMAGHSNVETTMRYYASATEDQIAQVRQASEKAFQAVASVETDAIVTRTGESADAPRNGVSCKSGESKDLG